MRILIVDDDLSDRRMLCHSLVNDRVKHEIFEANSVKEGLALLKNIHVDVVLLDYQMPDTDGLEMIFEIRSRPNLGDTAILVISGIEDPDIAIRCIEAGAQDVVHKNEITHYKLSRAMLQAKKRFEIEQRMHESYKMMKVMAEKDVLTGISNRYHFEEYIKDTTKNNRVTDQVALMALDLDNFKNVNDSLGHDVGDQILVEVAARISSCLRDSEEFARLGGDEFAIVLSNVDSVKLVNIVAKRIIRIFEKPFNVDGQELRCGVSMGVAFYPSDASSSKDLLKCADIAMYRAKEQGKNTLCFYQTSYQKEFDRRFKIQNDMIHLLTQSQFRLFYQAIRNTKSKSIQGFEALARWAPGPDSVMPDEFIPVAEDSGLIHELGHWIIKSAVKQLAIWQQSYDCKLTMSINISPIQLRNDGFVSYLTSVTKEHDVANDLVIIEITETALFNDSQKIINALGELSSLGFKIALDDFGMGFSSISHLIDYPIDIVKIDKSIQSLEGNFERKQKLFDGLTSILKKLDFITVAEGVETTQQLKICEQLGIDRFQGYLLNKPVSVDEVNEILTTLDIA